MFCFHSRNIFTQTKGSRPNVKKILIVITDGESHERDQLASAAAEAEAKNIVRFAIGVSSSALFTFTTTHTSVTKASLNITLSVLSNQTGCH